MNLLKKRIANNRLCAGRDNGRHSFRPLGQAGGINSSEINPDGPLVGRLTFIEDFTREHSFPVLHMASIEISGTF